MTDPLVSVHVEEGVAILTLNRPKARNALSDRQILELDQALAAAEQDDAVRVILLTGGAKVFAAGADIAEMEGLTFDEVVRRDFRGCSERLDTCRKPVVAAVAGYALGGGCELVEMCDIVVAADTAKFGHPEITLATMPGAGGTQRLTRAVGKHKAMDLLLTGRFIGADEAERIGLVSRVVPEGELMSEALGLAKRIAALSAAATLKIKAAVLHAATVGMQDGLRFERDRFHLTFASADLREGMRAFLEKRPPRFTHR